MSFGGRMRKLREMRGFSTTELAECACVSQPQIVKWESGQQLPNVIAAVLIAQKLGTTVEQLCAED